MTKAEIKKAYKLIKEEVCPKRRAAYRQILEAIAPGAERWQDNHRRERRFIIKSLRRP